MSTTINGFDVATIAANMMHDARNGVSVEIGSGIFSPAELRQAAMVLRAVPDLLTALRDIARYDSSTHAECAVMCRTTLIDTGGYKLVAKVTPVPTQPGYVRMHLSSTLASSRDPHGSRTVCDLILDADAARRLAGALAEESFT